MSPGYLLYKCRQCGEITKDIHGICEVHWCSAPRMRGIADLIGAEVDEDWSVGKAV